jgi:prepilin-type N-terminal cleavage/methylation domain-containing protein
MTRFNDKGFTLIELLVVITIIGILASIALPNYIKAKDKAREAEVKANVHSIQIALERYAVDHGGQYPKMLWGGDEKGWMPIEGVGCRTMWPSEHEPYNGTNETSAAPPFDPLIHLAYMTSYPRCAFLNDGEGLSTIIRWTGPSPCKIGDGDPRFGFAGEIMGNILEDPRYLWQRLPNGQIQLSRIKNCFLDEATTYYVGMVNGRTPANPFYAMGGIPEWKRFTEDVSSGWAISNLDSAITLKAFWAGEFFYRSGGTYLFQQNFLIDSLSNPNLNRIWNFRYTRIDRYFLGGFGSMRTDGKDVIRLTDVQGAAIDNRNGYQNGGNYEPHPNYTRTESTPIYFSSPECFGGGERGKMPYFPYLDPKNGEWIYGAPDGYRDGVIIALTSGTDAAGNW